MQICSRCHTSDNPDTAKSCYKCGGSPLRRYRKKNLNLSRADRAALANSSLQAGSVTGGLLVSVLLIFTLLLIGLSFWLVPSQSKTTTVLATSEAQLCNVQGRDLGKVQPGQRISGTITFGNCGGQPLVWQEEGNGSSWLQLDQSSGTLAPNKTEQISFTILVPLSEQGPLSVPVTIISGKGQLQQATVTMTVVPLPTPIPTPTVAPAPSPIPPTPTPTPTPGPVVRLITSQPQPRSKTVNATGQGITPGTGTQATGTIEIYNFGPAFHLDARKTLTNLADCGAKGMQISLDNAVDLPAGSSSEGSVATVSIYVVQLGAIGNINDNNCLSSTNNCDNPCYAFYVTCSLVTCDGPKDWTWEAVDRNYGFAGGTDPQTYTYVRQSDIDTAAASLPSLESSIQQSAIADIRNKMYNEHWINGGPQCTNNVTWDHKVGDPASTVTVTVQTTCKAWVST